MAASERGRPGFGPAVLPPIEELDRFDRAAFEAAVAPLFEGAPGLLSRLAEARPFGTLDRFFERARAAALALPEAAAIELLDAHPRLGAAPDSISMLSFAEQGYDAGAAGEDPAGDAVAAELSRLNEAYERRFGFRYCVFVAGRSRAELIPEFRAALSRPRRAELRRALEDVIAIAENRYRALAGSD